MENTILKFSIGKEYSNSLQITYDRFFKKEENYLLAFCTPNNSIRTEELSIKTAKVIHQSVTLPCFHGFIFDNQDSKN